MVFKLHWGYATLPCRSQNIVEFAINKETLDKFSFFYKK